MEHHRTETKHEHGGMKHDHGTAEQEHTPKTAPGTDGPVGTEHAGMAHAGMHQMKPNVTRPQLAVVTLLTVLALAVSVAIPAQYVNLGLSAEDVGGAIMPPGMVMTRDTPARRCGRCQRWIRMRSITQPLSRSAATNL